MSALSCCLPEQSGTLALERCCTALRKPWYTVAHMSFHIEVHISENKIDSDSVHLNKSVSKFFTCSLTVRHCVSYLVSQTSSCVVVHWLSHS